MNHEIRDAGANSHLAIYKDGEEKLYENSRGSGANSDERHHYNSKHSPKIDMGPIKPNPRLSKHQDHFEYDPEEDDSMLKGDMAEAEKYLNYDFGSINHDEYPECKFINTDKSNLYRPIR